MKEAPTPEGATAEGITAGDLRNRIAIFADDSMQGRRTGTPGNVKGNAYIAGELRRLGLRPAGDTGSYLQRVPLVSYAAVQRRHPHQRVEVTFSDLGEDDAEDDSVVPPHVAT